MSPSTERAAEGGLECLRRLLLEEGGLMASLVSTHAVRLEPGSQNTPQSPARVAAAGPRAAGRREEYELLVEAIYEGYLLHYGVSRVVRPPEADLALLAGDRLYAIGLSRLVEFGDSDAVAELADTITLSALAHGAGEEALAAAVWEGGARAVGWGPSAAHARAKELVLAGAPAAIEAMRTSAAGLLAPS